MYGFERDMSKGYIWKDVFLYFIEGYTNKACWHDVGGVRG